jgi:acyl-CoA synthetase (AMP-forming)/AMP-acid ligase II
MTGYFGRPAESAKAIRGGWLETGDLGFLHRGQLMLTGRSRDLLILRGRNHDPAEVEQAVEGIPGVRAGCAIACSWLPEGADGERLLLLVERTRSGETPPLDQIESRCREQVLASTGLRVDEVEIVAAGTLPRTSSGKLRRQAALKRWLSRSLEAPAKVSALRLGAAMIRSRWALWRGPRGL